MEMEMGEKKKKKKIELMKVDKVLKKHMANKKKMDMSTKKEDGDGEFGHGSLLGEDEPL